MAIAALTFLVYVANSLQNNRAHRRIATLEQVKPGAVGTTTNSTSNNPSTSSAGDIGPMIYENPRVHQELDEIDRAYHKLKLNRASCAQYSELKGLWARYLRLPINSTTGDRMYRSVETYEAAGCR